MIISKIMILIKQEIKKRIKDKKLVFSPNLDAFQLQPHAVDLRLGNVFHLPKTWDLNDSGRIAVNVDPMRLSNGSNYDEVKLKNGQFFEILPGEFVVGTTRERIEMNSEDLMAVLYPRSSINRRGLSVGMTGIVDAFYAGTLMIPIRNMTANQVIKIYPGERVCQLVFQLLQSPLSQKQAMMHGVEKAKYISRENGDIQTKSDKQEELDMIKKGKLAELKKKYSID